jgi:cohesin complex subunit SA-1/2
MTVSVSSKAHMEQVLAQAKVKITPASKVWDAQRAYEKRLTTMSKDKGIHPPPPPRMYSVG